MQQGGMQADITWRASAQSATGAEGGNSLASRESDVALDRYRGRAFIAPARMRPHILWVELL